MVYRLLFFISFIQILIAGFVQFGGELYMDGKNARNAGMGGYSASFSAGSNPARLIKHHVPSIYFSYKNKYSGLSSVTTLSYSYSQNINGNEYPIYISLINRRVNDIPDTRTAKSLDGSIDYSKIDYFSQNETGLVLASIYQSNKVKYGIAIKPFYMDLAEYNARGISGDIGIISHLLKNKLELGCQIENIFSLNYWDTGEVENYVPRFLLGGQFQFKYLLFGLEIGSRLTGNSPIHYHAGFEYLKPNQDLIFRGGIAHDSALTLGMGITVNLFQLDYAYIQMIKNSPLKTSHIFGLGISIDKLDELKDKISP